MLEDGAESLHTWTKGNSNEYLCWHSSKQWKRPKPFSERNNLWWIMGFFNTIQTVSANPCNGRAPFHQGKRKHGRANPNLKQRWSFISTTEWLFRWNGCLKARPLTRSTARRFWQTFVNGWEEEPLKCGRRAHGFFTKTTRRHTTPCLSRRFWRSTRSPCWNIHRAHLT